MSDGSAMSDAARHGPLPEGGTVRPMTRWGEPVMHRPQEPVTRSTTELRALVADMVATMYAADGVGLAACQIGVDRAVFVFDCPDDDGRAHRRRGLQPGAVPARGQATGSSTTTTRAACPCPARSCRAPARRTPGSTGRASTASR